MRSHEPSPVNDPGTVHREYATEEGFLARRLARWAELRGPLVEDATVEAVAEVKPARVLDVGCGTGDFTARLRGTPAVEVVALDSSRRMTELTRARGLDAVTGDIQALPFAGDAFDCVLANRVLYHLPDLDRGLAEIGRVLRPGGRFVAVTYGADHLAELWRLVGVSPMAPTFVAENGATSLRSHFDAVERRDITGHARFPSRDALLGFLTAYGAFSEIDLSTRLGAVAAPFDASYRHSIFVARKRA